MQLRGALLRGETGSKKNLDMLEFLEEFAGTDMGKASSFANKEKLQFAGDDDEAHEPKAATEEVCAVGNRLPPSLPHPGFSALVFVFLTTPFSAGAAGAAGSRGGEAAGRA